MMIKYDHDDDDDDDDDDVDANSDGDDETDTKKRFGSYAMEHLLVCCWFGHKGTLVANNFGSVAGGSRLAVSDAVLLGDNFWTV
jgi:hypothetical protein